jgi:hypothetical protein
MVSLGQAAGAVAYGIASGIAVGCAFPSTSSVAIGLALGAMFGLVVGFIVMLPRAWGTFVFSQVWLALRWQLPWRLMTFLADAHRRGVLRQAGGVYQFRHARLQDHLAGRKAGTAVKESELCPESSRGHQLNCGSPTWLGPPRSPAGSLGCSCRMEPHSIGCHMPATTPGLGKCGVFSLMSEPRL